MPENPHGRFITSVDVCQAIRSAIQEYYSDPWDRFRGDRPPETDVTSLIDGVLRRLFPSPSTSGRRAEKERE